MLLKFFLVRLNPAAINRLAPWLNRELNALLEENTQQVMTLVDVILTHLREHHIKGRFFRNLLSQYFGSKTSHFIHEFYNFMQSPFDMIGYDRHVLYTHRHIEIVSDIDNSSDSDVQVIENDNSVTSTLEPQNVDVIEIRSDSDSDVIIISDTENHVVNNVENIDAIDEQESRKPILPLKIRLKCKRQSREDHWKNKKRMKHLLSTSSSSDSETSRKSSYSSRKYRRKDKIKKCKTSDSAAPASRSHIDESSDDEPLSFLQRKLKSSVSNDRLKLKHKEKRKKIKRESPVTIKENCNVQYEIIEPKIDAENDRFAYPNTNGNDISNITDPQLKIKIKTDENGVSELVTFAGPSNDASKRENNNWYYRPQIYSDSDDE